MYSLSGKGMSSRGYSLGVTVDNVSTYNGSYFPLEEFFKVVATTFENWDMEFAIAFDRVHFFLICLRT